MVWVCGREFNQEEYLWGIDPAFPHEHGEPQVNGGEVDCPCDCVPVEISGEEFDRRREVKLSEVLQEL